MTALYDYLHLLSDCKTIFAIVTFAKMKQFVGPPHFAQQNRSPSSCVLRGQHNIKYHAHLVLACMQIERERINVRFREPTFYEPVFIMGGLVRGSQHTIRSSHSVANIFSILHNMYSMHAVDTNLLCVCVWLRLPLTTEMCAMRARSHGRRRRRRVSHAPPGVHESRRRRVAERTCIAHARRTCCCDGGGHTTQIRFISHSLIVRERAPWRGVAVQRAQRVSCVHSFIADLRCAALQQNVCDDALSPRCILAFTHEQRVPRKRTTRTRFVNRFIIMLLYMLRTRS